MITIFLFRHSCALFMLKNIQFWTGTELSSDYDQVHTLTFVNVNFLK